MVPTRKKKQQNKRLFIQLDELDADFTIGQSNHKSKAGSRNNAVNIGSSLYIMKGPIQVNSVQEAKHTLEENIVSKVQNEVDNMMTTVKTRF